jgi:glycosyltransferase involved in cell wall biosynthesis
MKYSIIIAERNETENLKQTIADIQATQKGEFEIIAISDTSGKGPQFCRNEGINRAKNDAVIITDAHMRFKPGVLDQQAEYIRKNSDHVTCAKCHHNAEMSFNDSPYCGARFSWKSQEREQFWILHGKWRERSEAGEIGCVMGACYAFSRARYIEILKSPWRFGKGWGMDEESLSLTNWLCGGSTVLLPVEVSHLYRVQSQVPFQLTHQQALGVWASRLAMIRMMPMSRDDKLELTEWLNRNQITQAYGTEMVRMLDLKGLDAQREYLEGQKRKFSEWKEKFINKTEEPEMSKTQIKGRLKRGGVKFNEKETRQNLMKMLNSPYSTLEKPAPAPLSAAVSGKKQYVTNCIVKDNGIPCLHCSARHDHKVTNTYPNGNRRMICSSCGLPFIAVRSV